MEREYHLAGDGQCKLIPQCRNHYSEYCYVCMYNTSATPRDYYNGEPLDEKERDELIES